MAFVGTTHRTLGSHNSESTNLRAMTMATTLFFMWGFLTCLNDILIPHLKAIFELSYGQVMLVQFAFFSAYLLFAWPSSKLVEWLGYKRSMMVGLSVMAAGALMFLPASGIPSFNVFLAALVLLAAGITCLQVSANPYVANLGSPETASSRLNLAQAFNSLGTTIAPFFGSILILGGRPLSATKLHSLSDALQQQSRIQQSASVRLPYVGIAATLIALVVALGLLHLPALHFTQDFRPPSRTDQTPGDSIWRHPQLIFGALGIFVYVGAEVAIGSFLINYLELRNIGNLTEKTAAMYVSLYWFGAMAGRFIGSLVLRWVRTSVALSVAAAMAATLVGLSVMSSGAVAMFSIIAVGLFNSIMFPCIFTLGIAGLRELTSRGSSLLVTAIVGGAIVPLLQGKLADHIGVQPALILPAVCYVYIVFFGVLVSRGPARTAVLSEAAVELVP